MMRRGPILFTLFVLLAWAMAGCTTGRSSEDLEGTIAARVVETLESAEATSAATLTPPAPTATPVPAPTAVPGPTVTPPPEIEAEEYAVFAALIQANPINFDLGESLVIREQTVADTESLEYIWDDVEPPPADLVDCYRSRNAARYTMSRNLDLAQDYSLMTEEEFDEVFNSGGPIRPKIEARYPGAEGVLIFSRVGFDADGDQALVLMGFRCGDLCGAGGLYLLVKEGGSWKFERSLMEWIS